jgi:hypothetical protein
VLTLAFCRIERTEVLGIVLLVVRTAHGHDVAFKAIRSAVTSWVATTACGRRVWEAALGNVTIGELVAHDAFSDAALVAALHTSGVEFIRCEPVAHDVAYSFEDTFVVHDPDAMPMQAPIVTDQIARPVRLTDSEGRWNGDRTFFVEGFDVAQYLRELFPDEAIPKKNDPRRFLGPVDGMSYLAGYRGTLGVMHEIALPYWKGNTRATIDLRSGGHYWPSELFQKVLAEFARELDIVQQRYPAAELTVACADATDNGCVALRGYTPVDWDFELAGTDITSVARLQAEIIAKAVRTGSPPAT